MSDALAWRQQMENEERRWFEEGQHLKQQPKQDETDMKMTDAFPSKYVRAADLPGDVEAAIESVELETLGQGSDQDTKPVIYFQGKKKGLVLNKTNGLQLAAAFGDETDDWKGKKIVLFSMKVQGPNGIVDGIRLRIPEQQSAPSGSGEQPSQDFDDDIPF